MKEKLKSLYEYILNENDTLQLKKKKLEITLKTIISLNNELDLFKEELDRLLTELEFKYDPKSAEKIENIRQISDNFTKNEEINLYFKNYKQNIKNIFSKNRKTINNFYEQIQNLMININTLSEKLLAMESEITVKRELQKIKETMEKSIFTIKDKYLVINDKIQEQTKPTIENDNEEKVLIHSTRLFPENKTIKSNYSTKREFPFSNIVDKHCKICKTYISNRHTIHFTQNSLVKNTADGNGIWNSHDYIIIEPLKNHINDIVDFSPSDTFTNNDIVLSNDAIILIDERLAPNLTEEELKNGNYLFYKGNAAICLKNLFLQLGIKYQINDANIANHRYSNYYRVEKTLDFRDCVFNNLNNKNILPEEIIAYLYNEYKRNIEFLEHPNENIIKEFSNKKGINIDFATFLLSLGININQGNIVFLDYDELIKNFDNNDYYCNLFSDIDLKEIQQSLEKINDEYLKNKYFYKQESAITLKDVYNNIFLKKILSNIWQKIGDEDKQLELNSEGLFLTNINNNFFYNRETSKDFIQIGKLDDTISEIYQNINKNHIIEPSSTIINRY